MAEHAHQHSTDERRVVRKASAAPAVVEAQTRGIVRPTRPTHMTANQLMTLQRRVGNRAVSGLVTPVQRAEPNDAEKRWAEAANTSVELVQDAVTKARDNLEKDARDALTAIRDVQTGYVTFEGKYDEALGNFIAGMAAAKAAQAKVDELKGFAKEAGDLVLGRYFKLLSEIKSKADKVLGYIDKAARVVKLLTPSPHPRPERPDRPGQANWSDLLSTTITAFETTLQQNAMLNALSSRCTENVRFLGRVRTGGFAGPSAESSPEGLRVAAMADNAAAAVSALSTVGTGEVSEPAKQFAAAAKAHLDKVTVRRLEQDIAIRWMGALSPDELDQIEVAEDYLASIGVINAGGNRLDYDTGIITTDVDEKLIQWLAKAESTAMSMVGHNAEWLGGRSVGGSVVGQIRDNRNRHWNAAAPAGTSENGGGTVRITTYWINRNPGESSSWEWSHSANLQLYLRNQVGFEVLPLGSTGGGATAEGPVLNPY
jgi:hypothetical protein